METNVWSGGSSKAQSAPSQVVQVCSVVNGQIVLVSVIATRAGGLKE